MSSWTNWIDDYGISTVQVYRPSSTREIVSLLGAARDSGCRIRALGSGHSMSVIGQPFEQAIDLSNLKGISVPPWLKASVDRSRLRRFESGTTVKLVNHRLWESDLALSNMGSWDGQTIAGAISTGTHGTGLSAGSMADSVRSLEVVTLDAATEEPVVLTIEPSMGAITDPSAFGQGDSVTYRRRLIQNDTVFYSAVVSGGLFGIIRSVVIECEACYWLRERYVCKSWRDLSQELRADAATFARQARHVQAAVNVHQAQVQADEGLSVNPQCSIVYREEASAATRPSSWDQQWPPLRDKTKINDFFEKHAPVNPTQLHPKVARKITGHFDDLAEEPHPFSGHDRSISCVVHRRLRGDFQDEEFPSPPSRIISLEVALPISEIAAAVDAVISYIVESDVAFQAPLGIRFAPPSRHYLATNYGRETAYLEVPFFIDKESVLTEVRENYAKPGLADIEQLLCYTGQFSGRPHIGKYNNLDPSNVGQVFPGFDEWVEAWRSMQPTDIHCNRFATQIGLAELRAGDEVDDVSAILLALELV